MKFTILPLMLYTLMHKKISVADWINNPQKPLEGERINFFENTFSEDVGNALVEAYEREDMPLLSEKK